MRNKIACIVELPFALRVPEARKGKETADGVSTLLLLPILWCVGSLWKPTDR